MNVKFPQSCSEANIIRETTSDFTYDLLLKLFVTVAYKSQALSIALSFLFNKPIVDQQQNTAQHT